MGLFGFLNNKKEKSYCPDLTKTEYDNWLSFLDQGGTSKEWDKLKKENKWVFQKDPKETSAQYEAKFRPLFNEYYSSALKIKSEWSIISKDKVYTGQRVEPFIELCNHNIESYKKMVKLENKYNEDHLQESEGYKRLAMLYEKQGCIEEVVLICKEAILLGDTKSMPSRLDRMIKKLQRQPTEEERNLILKGENK